MAGNLKVGDSIDRVMVVAKKVRRDYTGGIFLLFQFTDKEGTLKGVYWEPTPEEEASIRPNDVVRVKGELQDYQGNLQLKVSKIQKLDEDEYDPALFLPASSRDIGAVCDEILSTIESIGNPHTQALLKAIFGDEAFRERFAKAPAAKGWHHSYVGGLAEHVHDMMKLAIAACDVYPEADRDLLLAGVLIHDLGKMEEMSVTNHIEYSDRGRLMGHITLGVSFIDEYLRGMEGFPQEIEMQLKHMILSHHGLLEHGSPVVPMTIEALLLNYIDNMDAQVRGALMVLDRSGGETRWTDYVRLLDRFIYKGNPAEDEAEEEEAEEDE